MASLAKFLLLAEAIHPYLTIGTIDSGRENLLVSESVNNNTSFIWSIAELLRGDFKQFEYGKIVLSFVILRRLDCLLDKTKETALAEAAALPVPLPPLDEQAAIARHLEAFQASVDAISDKTRVAIEKLKEPRAALITPAVTGQIDVETYGKADAAAAALDKIVNRPVFTGGQNSRRIAHYGTCTKEEDLEAVFTRVPRTCGAAFVGTPR